MICSVPRFQLRFSFMQVEYGNLYAALDIAKVCDCLVLLVDVAEGIDAVGDYIFSCVSAQSLPTLNVLTMVRVTYLHAVIGLKVTCFFVCLFYVSLEQSGTKTKTI